MVALERYKEAFGRLPEGVREAEVNAESHKAVTLEMERGSRQSIEVSESTELFIRVSGEKTGFAYTQDAGENPDEAIRLAFANSLCSDREEPDCMNREGRVWAGPEERAGSDVEELTAAAEGLENKIRALTAALLNEKGLKTRPENLELSVSLKAETYGQHTVNSYGLDSSAAAPAYVLNVSASAGKEGVRFSQVKNSPGDYRPEEIAEDLSRRLAWLETEAEGLIPGECEIILSEYAVSQLFMTAWQEFSAVKYADGACALAGLLGEKIAPRALTITDCPLPEKEGGYPAFCDAEGTEGVPVRLVDKGVFAGLMTNQTTAGRLKLPATGNAGRRPLLFGNIATDILVTPKNFCIEPGEFTLAEMEEHMGDGILITEYFDLFHSLDIASGNFSVPCYGIVIMGGKECGCVRGLTLSGNIRDLLGGVTEVGNHRVIHPMEFLENYGIGSCAMRTGRLSVSGE